MRSRAVAWASKFSFSKIPGGPNINNFCETWHEASFYIKEQMQKNKFEILVLKTTILDPQKTKEKHEENFCLKVYISKLENALFQGSTNFFLLLLLKQSMH